MTPTRRATTALAALGVAALTGLGLAAPALAASSIAFTVGKDAVKGPVTAHGTVTIAGALDQGAGGDADLGGVAQLRLPDGTDPAKAVVLATAPHGNPGDDRTHVSFDLTTTPCNLPVTRAGSADAAACDKALDLPNGSYPVQLWQTGTLNDKQVGNAATLVIDVPARTPTGVKAVLDGRTVRVSWDRGAEPDLLHWDVRDGAGRAVTLTPAQACTPKDGCGAVFPYATSDSGSRTYAVTATRQCGQDKCTPKASPAATSGSVTLPPPGASPTPSGSAAAGGRASATPSSGSSTAALLPRGFVGPAPALGLPRLPTTAPAPGVAAPQVADTYKPTLDYGAEPGDDTEPGEPEAVTPAAPGRPSVLRSTGGGAPFGNDRVVQGLAGFLVLALGGAHLRSFVSRPPLD